MVDSPRYFHAPDALWHFHEGRLDHLADAFLDAEVLEAPEELFDAAAADAFGADVQRCGGGMQTIEIGHLVIAGDDADTGRISVAHADPRCPQRGVNRGRVAVFSQKQSLRA